ncbi:uncharacterized protein LOC122307457 [Carya illinoinensis]|uniref:uncharacterized protein LOC122307457 n=1 Tax=Carya illinoinensis TaxID=32201 RepID=UPI001C7203C9|nr:uncharacterized protein LOC122307457 [Carya illinoinensis]
MDSDSSDSDSPSSILPASLDNPSNPYFLHHGENPGVILVTDRLNGDNYHSWSRSMSKVISAKNKTGFITGIHKKPKSKADPLYLPWIRCNDMVVSWILNSVAKNIGSSILYIDNASDMWKDLQDRFSQGNRPRIFQLHKAISSLKQDQKSVSDYYTELKSFWDELANYRRLPQCSVETLRFFEEIQQEEYVMQFLMGLSDSFNSIRSQILLIDPFPSMNKVISLVLQEEKQREITLETSVPSLESVAALTAKPMKIGTNASKQTNFRKDKPVCSHCGYTGHTSEKCYKIHGFPPGFKSKRGNNASAYQSYSSMGKSNDDAPKFSLSQDQYQQLLAMLKTTIYFIISESSQLWHFTNSTATFH